MQKRLFLEALFQEEVFKVQIETQEAAICQVSEEIHNNVGQLLSTTKILLGATERNLKNIPETLTTAGHVLAKAIQELRLLAKSLSKDSLQGNNLSHSIKAEVNRIKTSQLANAVYASATDNFLITGEMQLILFRVIQEVIHSRIENALATEIIIKDVFCEGNLVFVIIDNGTSDYGSLFESQNIIRRIQLLHGTLGCRDASLGKEIKIAIPTE